MRAVEILSLGLALVMLAAPVMAGESEDGEEESAQDFGREGLYIGGSGVYAIEAWRGNPEDNNVENTAGLNGYLGYRVNEFASLEIHIEWVNNFLNDNPGQLGGVTSSVRTKVYATQSRLQPYATVGAGILATTINKSNNIEGINKAQSDWAFRFGGGIDFYLTENWALNAEATYLWTVGDVKQLDYSSIGLGILYRF